MPQPAPGDASDIYGISFLYSQLPTLDRTRILEKLRERSPASTLLDEEAEDLAAIMHQDDAVTYPDGRTFPAQTLLFPADRPADLNVLQESISQSWSWEDLPQEEVLSHGAVLTISDFLASPLPRRRRLELLQGVAWAVARCAPPLAVHSPVTCQVVSPKSFVEAVESDWHPLAVPGALNVRFYRIDSYGDAPGKVFDDMLMECMTLGRTIYDSLMKC